MFDGVIIGHVSTLENKLPRNFDLLQNFLPFGFYCRTITSHQKMTMHFNISSTKIRKFLEKAGIEANKIFIPTLFLENN